MTEENQTEETVESLPVEVIFEGECPSDNSEAYLEVTAKASVKENGVITSYKTTRGFFPFGSDISDAIERYTDAVIFSNYRKQAKIQLQSLMRSHLLAGKSIADLLETWKPGVQMERVPVNPLDAAASKFDTLPADEQQAFLEMLIKKQAG